LTLIQTGKVRDFPVVLFGTRYWQGLLDWIRNTMVAEGKVSPTDLRLMVVTDSPEETVKVIVECFEDHCERAVAQAQEKAAVPALRPRMRGGMRSGIVPPYRK
jgi:predicted Rossmann-fold nucleotide-binding protein